MAIRERTHDSSAAFALQFRLPPRVDAGLHLRCCIALMLSQADAGLAAVDPSTHGGRLRERGHVERTGAGFRGDPYGYIVTEAGLQAAAEQRRREREAEHDQS